MSLPVYSVRPCIRQQIVAIDSTKELVGSAHSDFRLATGTLSGGTVE